MHGQNEQERNLPPLEKVVIRTFEKIASQSGLGFYILDNGIFCFANRWLCGVLQVDDPDALQGKSFLEFVHPEDRRRVRQDKPFEKAAELEKGVPFRFLAKHGDASWVLAGGCRVLYQGRTAEAGFVIDATLMKIMRDSLRRYETIMNNADLSLSEIDLKGNLTFVNDAGCRMWGVDREDIIGDRYKAKMPPDKKIYAEAVFRSIYETGRPVQNLVYEFTRSNGQKRMAEDSISLIRHADGAVYGFVRVIKDITERKEAENKINEQRLRLAAIFDSVQDGIIMVDPALCVIEANKSAEGICGVMLPDMIGRAFGEWESSCSRACREILSQTLRDKKAIRDHHIECERRTHRGQVVGVSCSPLLDERGNFMGAALTVRDMTLLRGLERELRERSSFASLIGRNRTMQDIYALLEDLASLETTVLVTGESGTGKELVARAMHYSGNRAFKPFITVNCSALTESLLESELFGHVKGAFTGAIKDREGRFAAATGGTILLDEIGDISARIQLKLLRVLQEKEVERVGESVSRKIDVRVIACTNRDLKQKVERGEFRQDLYYRLKVVEIQLPPLRKRLEDLPLLVDHFLRVFNEKFHKALEGISPEVLDALMSYSWPGNVRELEHVMEHAFVLCRGGTITMQHMPSDIKIQKKLSPCAALPARATQTIAEQDILSALDKTGGNKAKAARLLKLSRSTIYRKLEEYRLAAGGSESFGDR